MPSINDTIIQVFELDSNNVQSGPPINFREHESVTEKTIPNLKEDTKYKIELYTPNTPKKILIHSTDKAETTILIPLKTLSITDLTEDGFTVRWTKT